MNHGWIKVHRKIIDSPLWFSEPFTKSQAWIDILLVANHADTHFFKRGIKIDVKRGQCARSEVELADRWKWSRTKVKSFLNMLEKEQQISIEKSNITQIVTIIKYEEYQSEKQQTVQQKSSRKAANCTTEKHIQECKEGKEPKEGKEKSTYGQFENVFLSEEEFLKLKEKYNGTLQEKIEALSMGIASKGYKYKSHYATILSWDRKNGGGRKNAGEPDEQQWARLQKLFHDRNENGGTV